MAGDSPPADLLIFDCDGVLVDSEPLSFDCVLAALHQEGWFLDRQEAMARFLGRSVTHVEQSLAAATGRTPPADFIPRLQRATLALFAAKLQPMPGIRELLAVLDRPCCVASSSQPERIRLSLEVTGLLGYFEPHIFSASQVARGKPAPDLFLHAAACMGTSPQRCLVVEDSLAGIQAACAAGMTVVGFTGGGHLEYGSVAEAMLEAGAMTVLERWEDLRPLLGIR